MRDTHDEREQQRTGMRSRHMTDKTPTKPRSEANSRRLHATVPCSAHLSVTQRTEHNDRSKTAKNGPQMDSVLTTFSTSKLAHLQAFPTIGETGFEPATARPPAGCATRLRHSPWLAQAGDGNRTRPRSLEGFCATTTLRPPASIHLTGDGPQRAWAFTPPTSTPPGPVTPPRTPTRPPYGPRRAPPPSPRPSPAAAKVRTSYRARHPASPRTR